jgi:hypothetical protein
MFVIIPLICQSCHIDATCYRLSSALCITGHCAVPHAMRYGTAHSCSCAGGIWLISSVLVNDLVGLWTLTKQQHASCS